MISNYIPVSQRNVKPSGGGNSVDSILASIKQTESHGDYGAIGKKTKSGDEALGAYQIMDKMNLKSWSKEALGREVPRDEFLASPEIQDMVARHRVTQIHKKYGNAQDVASVWFTGQPYKKAGGKVADVTGTTNAQYVGQFNKNLSYSSPLVMRQYIPLIERL